MALHLRQHAPAGFGSPSEAEFAKLLELYKIRGPYEPKTFPLPWHAQGRILERVTPDLYLPDQDRSLKLTTQTQRLVTKKNRQMRLLQELYPEVHLHIVYRRDVARLRQKYGGPWAQKSLGNLLTSQDP